MLVRVKYYYCLKIFQTVDLIQLITGVYIMDKALAFISFFCVPKVYGHTELTPQTERRLRRHRKNKNDFLIPTLIYLSQK